MATAKILEIRGFRGINNVEDGARINIGAKSGMAFLKKAKNIDIDNSFMAHRRSGHGGKAYDAIVRTHSLWSDDETCLFVDGNDLMMLRTDFTASVVRPGVGDSRMNYAKVPNKIAFTNNSIIGYLQDGVAYEFPDPELTYKTKMKAGHLMEYFGDRLYVPRGNILWYSDPVAWMRTDERRNFKQFKGYMTMVRRVSSGLYVSDSYATYFMSGLNPAEATMTKVDDYPAILGSVVQIDGQLIGNGMPGVVLLWLTKIGLALGADGGAFQYLTKDFYRAQVIYPGSAVLRQRGKYFQYLASQKGSPDTEVDFESAPLQATGSLTFEQAIE